MLELTCWKIEAGDEIGDGKARPRRRVSVFVLSACIESDRHIPAVFLKHRQPMAAGPLSTERLTSGAGQSIAVSHLIVLHCDLLRTNPREPLHRPAEIRHAAYTPPEMIPR